MARILIVGIDPDLVDFSDPALPPGLNADAVRQGVERTLDTLCQVGHEPHHLNISPDPTAIGTLAEKLTQERFDCVVVGGGVPLPPANLILFEAVLNTIGRAMPAPAIALAARPDGAAEAVARVLTR